MKKFYLISAACAALALSASCTKENGLELRKTTTIEATSELGKTSLDGLNVVWNAGDAISVLYGTENKQFTTTDSGATAGFTGEGEPTGDTYAVYPYSAKNSLSGSTVRVTIPEVQFARSDNYADGANVSVGKVVSGKVTMYNVGGLIKLPIAGSDITSVTLRATMNATTHAIVPVSGTFDVDLSGTEPAATAYSTSHMVKLLPPSGETVFAPGTYYIAVAPVSMADGFELIYTKANARGVKATTTACTIARAHIKPIAAQDGGITFTTGRFIELIACDESTRTAVQPFTENLTTGGSSPSSTPKKGYFYQNCDEEYMYKLSSSDESTGYFLASGSGRVGMYCKGTDLMDLPNFVHKELNSIELYSTVTPETSNGLNPPTVGSTVTLTLKNLSAGTSTNKTLYWNGQWWPVSGKWSYGISYGQMDVTSAGLNTPYSLVKTQIRKMTLFYAGADVEEVVSVKATVPDEVVKADLPETINGSFKSWNYGDGATYVAGIEYKASAADSWTSVTGIVTGQTFSVELPNTMDIDTYTVRPWAGVDGVDGGKVYGAEATLNISGEVTQKTLTYNFLQGEPSTWSSTTPKTAAQWPFDADSSPKKTQIGTRVTLKDASNNILVADYTNISSEGDKLANTLVSGRGWQLRNAYDATTKTGYFILELPKFETLALKKVTYSSYYSAGDGLVIVDLSGTVLTGGTSKSIKGSGSPLIWEVSGTAVNTVYAIKSNGTTGYFFDPSAITLYYEKPAPTE